MVKIPDDRLSVDTEINVPTAKVTLVRRECLDAFETALTPHPRYQLEMGLTSASLNTRVCYQEHWGSQRFEPVGNVFLLPPGKAVLMRHAGSKAHALIRCQIDPAVITDRVGSPLKWTPERLQASLDIRDTNIQYLLRRLANELRFPDFASELLVDLLTSQLAVEIARYFDPIDAARRNPALAPWRLRLIDQRLSEQHRTPALSELASLCRLSIRQLTRGFRASRGLSVGDYIARRRIDYAKRMLSGEDSIKSIAYSLGFSTPAAFSTAFRRATGVKPSEFRASVSRFARQLP